MLDCLQNMKRLCDRACLYWKFFNMSNLKKLLVIIPARSGSKGLPDKNIRKFCGKPLLAWPIRVAIESGVASRVVLSTDSKEICHYWRKVRCRSIFFAPS